MAVTTEQIADARARLYSGVLSDILDALGITGRVMDHTIRPLDDSLVLAGRARTGLFMDVYHVPAGENPYDMEITLVDDLKPDDVAVFSCSATARYVSWGELLTTAAHARGGTGCVTDGLVRDVRFIREMRFPVFQRGIRPLESGGRGALAAIDVPAECGGAQVVPGDLVFGDVDGVVVVPAEAADEVLRRAFEKVSGEDRTRAALQRGMKLREVYDRWGVL